MKGWVAPWRAASAVWGPYGAGLRQQFGRGEFGTDDLLGTPDAGLDPLLRFLIPVRLWFGLGIVVWTVNLLSEPHPVRAFEDAAIHGVITMILGPYGVLLGVFVVAALARFRRSVLRLLIRPTLVAVVTIAVAVVVFGLQLSVVRQVLPRNLSPGNLLVEMPLPVQFVAGLAGSLASLWLGIFGVCGVYLMHRNGFSAHSHPLLRPIVAIWLSAVVAAAELSIGDHPGVDRTWFVVSALAGPIAVTALSVVELVRLKRLGIGPGHPGRTEVMS